MGESQRLVQARHSAADFAFANPEVTGDALIGKVALDQPQQLEFGSPEVASQLLGGKAMHPGRSCHCVESDTLWLRCGNFT